MLSKRSNGKFITPNKIALDKIAKIVQKYNKNKDQKEYAFVSEDGSKVLEWLGKQKPSAKKQRSLEKRIQFFKNVKKHPKKMKKIIRTKKLKKKLGSKLEIFDFETAYRYGICFRFGTSGFKINVPMAVRFLTIAHLGKYNKATIELKDMAIRGEAVDYTAPSKEYSGQLGLSGPEGVGGQTDSQGTDSIHGESDSKSLLFKYKKQSQDLLDRLSKDIEDAQLPESIPFFTELKDNINTTRSVLSEE